jgi:2-polyprenyl-3-methyl-5-hydroxy-6-metoxy-1,4-benzoquinol methylase
VDKDTIIKLNKSGGKKGSFIQSMEESRLVTPRKYVELYHKLNKVYSIRAKKVLDAGCRVGVYSYLLTKIGYKVIGFDIVPEHVEEAVKYGIKAVECDLCDMKKTEDNTFDSLFCKDVIEHLYDAKKAFKEFVRVVNKGGSIFLSGPLEPNKHTKSHLTIFKDMESVEKIIPTDGFNVLMVQEVPFDETSFLIFGEVV